MSRNSQRNFFTGLMSMQSLLSKKEKKRQRGKIRITEEKKTQQNIHTITIYR